MSILRRCPVLSVVVTALIAASAPSLAQEPTWKPAAGMPPSELRWQGKHKASLAFKEQSVTGKARWDLRGKLVSVHWTHEPSLSSDLQQFETTYWPTAIAELSDGKTLVVAGKRPDGNTIIEAWRFRVPEVVDKNDGSGDFLVKPAVIESTDTVYDAAAQGRDLVVQIVGKLGSPSGLFVQFVDSRAVYDFDLAAKPPTFKLVASPNAEASIPAVPQLVQRYTRAWAVDDAARGHMYVFSNDEHEEVATLVLLDADRNGTLDASVVVKAAQWTAEGWGKPANYR